MQTKDIQTIYEEIKELYLKGISKFYLIDSNGNKYLKRINETDNGTLLVMKSKRRGYYLYGESWIKEFIPKIEKPAHIKWEKSIKKAISMLEKSGFWSELKEDLNKALSVGYDNLQKAYKLYWENFTDDYYENMEIRTQKIKEISPLLISVNDENKEYPNTTILFHFCNELKIKKMYFGKYSNESKLRAIKDAILNNKDIYVSGRTSYDVSFSYKANCKKAWYSEEFKDCGNGHYYLALNHTHAFHYEDD